MFLERVFYLHSRIVVTGHYGSGKTEFSLNLAYKLRAEGHKVSIVDLDIVNPYFRTADDVAALEQAGIKTIIPPYANTNVDLPSLTAEVYSAFEADGYVIFDVGGNDDGAIALGRYYSYFSQKPYDMFGVINTRRPLTSTAEEITAGLRDIEAVSRLKFTGLINNTNLSVETDRDTVLSGIDTVNAAAEMMGLDVRYISVPQDLADKLPEIPEDKLFPMEIRLKKW